MRIDITAWLSPPPERFPIQTRRTKPAPLLPLMRRALFAEIENREGKNGGKPSGSALRTTCRRRANVGAPADVKKVRATSGLFELVVEFQRLWAWLATPVCKGPLSCHRRRTAVDPQMTVVRAPSFGRLSGRSRHSTRSLTGSSPAIFASSPGAQDTDRASRAHPRHPASEITCVIRRAGAISARKLSALATP